MRRTFILLLRGRVSYLFISVIDRLSAVITSLYLAKVYLKLTLLTQDQNHFYVRPISGEVGALIIMYFSFDT